MSMEERDKRLLAEEKEASAILWEIAHALETRTCDRAKHGGSTCIENLESDDNGPVNAGDLKDLCPRCVLTWAYRELDTLEVARALAKAQDGPQDDRRLERSRPARLDFLQKDKPEGGTCG